MKLSYSTEPSPADPEGQVSVSSSPAQLWEPPLPCPQCLAVAGKPVATSTTRDPQLITVTLCCTECRHQWNRDLPYIGLAAGRETTGGAPATG
jgi:hypothetical protein